MKKNISINIGGIIFHIEEDGYQRLKAYLESINRYFSSFDDSKEIIDDIESRIAEIFLSKLSDVKQVIVLVDVEELIATMGTTKDFEASIETEPLVVAEPQPALSSEPAGEKGAESKKDQKEESASTDDSAGTRRLYRDGQRKVLGGVCSGIANYFGIDPIWIRLLYLALFFNVFIGEFTGFVILGYIILWIVIPQRDDLEEDQKMKKLFRSSDDKVLGGVCAGLGSYFGIDTTVIRLIFVIALFFGGGVIVYLVLWIITPEAKSLTEKMQMEGQPVTIRNIEANVKRNLNIKEGEETAASKILLFPFRILAQVIEVLSKALGPAALVLVELLRIFAGAVIILVGFSLMFAFTIALMVLLGFHSTFWVDQVHLGDFPIELALSTFSGLSIVSAYLIVFVPSLAVTLAGFMIILKRRIGNAYLGWALFGIWILGLIGAAFFLPSTVREFRSDGFVVQEATYELQESIPTLRLDDTRLSRYEGVELRVRGHADSIYRLETRIESRGSSRDNARQNAGAISYEVDRRGTDFYFPEKIEFPGDVKFRFQEVDAIFYIPNGQTFRMDPELRNILKGTLYLEGYRSYQMAENDWVFDDGRLRCVTCERQPNDEARDEDEAERPTRNERRSQAWEDIRGEEVRFEYRDFDEVRISSFFRVYINESEDFEVIIKGDNRDLSDVQVRRRGDQLEVKHRDHEWGWWENNSWSDDIAVYISMPELSELELLGATKGEISGFNNESMDINLEGASDLLAKISPDYLNLDAVGASMITLEGNTRKLRADIKGASKLDALDFRTQYIELDVTGTSKATIYATEEIDVRSAGLSRVTYRGNARVRADEDGLGTVKRYRE